MDNSQGQFYNPEPAPRSKSKTKLIIFIVLLLVIAGLAIFGTMRFLKARDNALELTPSPTEEFSIPTEPPTPTEEEPESTASGTLTPTGKLSPSTSPTKSAGSSASVDKATGLDRANLTIQVLNGSGTAGVANKMKAYLEDLGYVVSSTGNADNYDYTKTVVSVKATKKSYLPLLEKDLGSSYTVGSTSATFTGSTDAQVIVGKE